MDKQEFFMTESSPVSMYMSLKTLIADSIWVAQNFLIIYWASIQGIIHINK